MVAKCQSALAQSVGRSDARLELIERINTTASNLYETSCLEATLPEKLLVGGRHAAYTLEQYELSLLLARATQPSRSLYGSSLPKQPEREHFAVVTVTGYRAM